jgi:hypothetical protein
MWCKESNYNALGRLKFRGELERCVPSLRIVTENSGRAATRKQVQMCVGLVVLTDGDDFDA